MIIENTINNESIMALLILLVLHKSLNFKMPGGGAGFDPFINVNHGEGGGLQNVLRPPTSPSKQSFNK